MSDKFTEASYELEEKNAYVCETCNDFYGHGKKDNKERDLKHAVKIDKSDEGKARVIKH